VGGTHKRREGDKGRVNLPAHTEEVRGEIRLVSRRSGLPLITGDGYSRRVDKKTTRNRNGGSKQKGGESRPCRGGSGEREDKNSRPRVARVDYIPSGGRKERPEGSRRGGRQTGEEPKTQIENSPLGLRSVFQLQKSSLENELKKAKKRI